MIPDGAIVSGFISKIVIDSVDLPKDKIQNAADGIKDELDDTKIRRI